MLLPRTAGRAIVLAAVLVAGGAGGYVFARDGDDASRVTLPTACDNVAVMSEAAAAELVSIDALLTHGNDIEATVDALEASCEGA